MTDVLINKKQGEDIYNIIIGEKGNIDKLKMEYNNYIDEFVELKAEIF